MKKIDLNVDIGEGFLFDRELLKFASSANVCCGAHAGNWELTLETIELCRASAVRIGMHPGFPDRESMGRISPPTYRQDYADSLIDQADRFMAVVPAAYCKPHGAWYNGLVKGEFLTPLETILARYPLDLMFLPLAPCVGLWPERIIREGFADRGYREDGTLVPRTEGGAVLHQPAEIQAQVLDLAQRVDSICLHGDTPGCLDFAELVTKTLTDAGWEIGS